MAIAEKLFAGSDPGKDAEEAVVHRVHHELESIVEAKKCEYIEAITEFCENFDIEYDEVVQALSPSILEKVRKEAIENGYIRKSSHVELPL